jgi:hypothetical protein
VTIPASCRSDDERAHASRPEHALCLGDQHAELPEVRQRVYGVDRRVAAVAPPDIVWR